jgi:hypothetical protein
MVHLPFSLEPRAYVPESYIRLQQEKFVEDFGKYISENQDQIHAEIAKSGRWDYCLEHQDECLEKLFEKWRDEQLEELLDSYPD